MRITTELDPNLSLAEIESPTRGKVLLNRGFLFLWIGQICAQLADRIFMYVFMIMAYHLTKTMQGVAIPMLAFGIPSVIFGSVAGVFVDRWDRKFILVISDFLRGALILLPIFGIGNSLVGLFALAFVMYSITQFFAPAESASIPEVVHPKDLLAANSLFLVTWMFSLIIGFGLGAPILSILGERGTLTMAVALYFLSGTSVFLSPIRSQIRERGADIKAMAGDLLFGFQYIFQRGEIVATLFKMFMASSGMAIFSVIGLGYAKDVLGIGETNFGYLIIGAGIGMFLGMLILSRLGHRIRRGWLVTLSFLATGSLLWSLSRVSTWPVALGIILLLGVANIFITATLQTVLQEEVPRLLRGRVFGAQNMLINSAFTIPPYLFAILADTYSVGMAMSILGIILVTTGFASILLPRFKTV